MIWKLFRNSFRFCFFFKRSVFQKRFFRSVEFVEPEQLQVGLVKDSFVLYEILGKRQTVFQRLVHQVFIYPKPFQVFYRILHDRKT